MPNIHPGWLLVVAVIVLIFFGPGRLPEIGSAAGRALREFRKATDEIKAEISSVTAPQASAGSAPPAAAGGAGPAGRAGGIRDRGSYELTTGVSALPG